MSFMKGQVGPFSILHKYRELDQFWSTNKNKLVLSEGSDLTLDAFELPPDLMISEAKPNMYCTTRNAPRNRQVAIGSDGTPIWIFGHTLGKIYRGSPTRRRHVRCLLPGTSDEGYKRDCHEMQTVEFKHFSPVIL